MKLSKAYGRQVFLNCPFDDGYIREDELQFVEYVHFALELLQDRDSRR